MRLLIVLFLISTTSYGQNNYQRNYFDNRNLKSEGWLKNNQKNDYWKFYYKNGNLKKKVIFQKTKRQIIGIFTLKMV